MTGNAMIFMMRFAFVRAMVVALVGTGGIVRTAWNPALAAVAANGGIVPAWTEASGAMVIPTSEGAADGSFVASIVGISRYISLTFNGVDTRMILTFVRVSLKGGNGTSADRAFVIIANIAVFAGCLYRIRAVFKDTRPVPDKPGFRRSQFIRRSEHNNRYAAYRFQQEISGFGLCRLRAFVAVDMRRFAIIAEAFRFIIVTTAFFSAIIATAFFFAIIATAFCSAITATVFCFAITITFMRGLVFSRQRR